MRTTYPKSDSWLFGILLMNFIVSGAKHKLEEHSLVQIYSNPSYVINKVLRNLGLTQSENRQMIQKFLERLVCSSVKTRFSLEEILEHEFFKATKATIAKSEALRN